MLEAPYEETVTLSCTECSHLALWPFQLARHVQTNHGSIQAPKLFNANEELEQHSCFCCGFKSYHKLDLYEHCRNEHDAGCVENDFENKAVSKGFSKYSCDSCKYNGHSTLFLIGHICEMVPKVLEVDVFLLEQGQSFQIASDESHCSYKTETTDRMVKHVRYENINWFNCAKCSYRANRRYTLKRHMLIHARDNTAWFNCSKCSYGSKYKRFVRRHMVSHATDDSVTWFNCIKCSYRTKQIFKFKQHVLTHSVDSGITWFNCPKCSYGSKYKTCIRRHMLSHASDDGITWFRCAKCSYRTKYKFDFKQHFRVHAGDDGIIWHNCFKCAYKSKHKKNVRRHMLTHAAEDEIDWLQCTKCSYRSKYKSGLETHIRVHAKDGDIRWFYCSKCSYRGKHQRNLDLHELNHASGVDIRWFNCTLCSHRSKQKGNLKRHMQTVHYSEIYGKQNTAETALVDDMDIGLKCLRTGAAELAAEETEKDEEVTIFRKDGFALIRSSMNAICGLLKDKNKDNN